MKNEFGKAAMKFKVWIPDWWRIRFGEEGSARQAWRNMWKDGFAELRQDIRSKGEVLNETGQSQNHLIFLSLSILAGILRNSWGVY